MAARVFVTTTLAAATGGITSVLWGRAVGKTRSYDVPSMCNGILVGLVSITAGCATVTPWAAIISAFIGALICRGASKLVLHKMGIDDPLDAFAVHGAGGLWGVVAASLFTKPAYSRIVYDSERAGAFYGGGGERLGAAVVFCIVHVAWVGILSTIIFTALDAFGVLRVRGVGRGKLPAGQAYPETMDLDMEGSRGGSRYSSPRLGPTAAALDDG